MISGNILNVFTGDIYPAEIEVAGGRVRCVRSISGNFSDIIIPGFIDAHLHIESSMLIPSSFAAAAIPHGTVSAISDPHEIANVMGVDGVRFMIDDAAATPMKFYFTAPSCVPATPFETAGAEITARGIEELLRMDSVVALGEMMNFPAVIAGDDGVMAKIKAARDLNMPVDGHAPLLSGDELCTYIGAGISTDHECVSPEEVLEKRRLGMKIMAREGSSARNLRDLAAAGCDFLVSDDIHPADLLEGHMDRILRRAVDYGIDPVSAVQMVTINPAEHYGLSTGAIAPGWDADFVVVDSLRDFNVKRVYIDGRPVADRGRYLIRRSGGTRAPPRKLEVPDFPVERLNIRAEGDEATVRVIDVLDGQLITEELIATLEVEDGTVQADTSSDILRVSVLDRYGRGNISSGFVHGFGLQEGAIASTVAHDSHNLIVVGVDPELMKRAVDILKKAGGGLVAVSGDDHRVLQLPVAGLMSDGDVFEVADGFENLNTFTEQLGSRLSAPFMTMSFLSLLVIPRLKIGDRGLFDVEKFEIKNLMEM
ncbi:adenine deaminase [Methanothermobacter thermautotrophicus str. Delta H]|uniref:Adenine deaminase n=1 Tax=Methanothermobacter thermautotrophicus (strain ATCC 29096 / DSM 1053 / JCM 10044 / NBRC 100330 / Delta H) TaxID=187420 RepID=ADEC_METTH|nr:adenine deaminase [Methanothermobacter thermautotrophicus]O26952.1 RecName: Full=Adenine deaminase; Short=Adenase; Short=Adenine aminase [Methanothermobacter thermautotrophicus str. Delta H]AAB85364.1 adenine deaminase [Methanothermobacter thermautotrophicus str. Delta H]WBF07082.1 adenine deaminase [Methanothermobacter thermautotrophicus]